MSHEITHVCIHPNKHHSYSDVFGSREPAAYVIGRPDGSPMKLFNLGEDETVSLLTTLPEELLEVVKSHYGLIEGEHKPFNPAELSEEMIGEIKRHYNLIEIAANVTITDTITDEELITLLNEVDEQPKHDDYMVLGTLNELNENMDVDLEKIELPQLRELAKGLEIPNYYSKGRERLITEINQAVDSVSDDN